MSADPTPAACDAPTPLPFQLGYAIAGNSAAAPPSRPSEGLLWPR